MIHEIIVEVICIFWKYITTYNYNNYGWQISIWTFRGWNVFINLYDVFTYLRVYLLIKRIVGFRIWFYKFVYMDNYVYLFIRSIFLMKMALFVFHYWLIKVRVQVSVKLSILLVGRTVFEFFKLPFTMCRPRIHFSEFKLYFIIQGTCNYAGYNTKRIFLWDKSTMLKKGCFMEISIIATIYEFFFIYLTFKPVIKNYFN